MNKLVRLIVIWMTCLSIVTCSVPIQAQSTATNLCVSEGTILAFFNGVLTTERKAGELLQYLRRVHGDTLSNGEGVRYELMYNYTNGLDDFVETFDQRMKEQDGILANRFELFLEAMSGGGRWWFNINNAIAKTTTLLDELKSDVQASITKNLTSLLGNPPTTLNYQEQRSRIDNFILEGKKLLFVAHSQGNLFVNPAYDYAITKTPSSAVKVIHVAPASPTIRGPHVLADLDLVINGLRLAGGKVQPITDSIPGYLLRPAGANGQKDFLGHGMFEIYANQQLDISQKVKGYINAGLNSLVAPPAKATTGFFSATLTWNGLGDVDTHLTEPDGAHVWYNKKIGHAGYLDVDNTFGYGPEHYYASCDSQKLQVGNYTIAVANYSNADGRTATVQISSFNDGVLGTKSVTLGAATGNLPFATLFNVAVSKDNSGKFKVAIVN